MKLIIKRALLGMCLAAGVFSLSACKRAETVSSRVASETQFQLKQEAATYLAAYLKVADGEADGVRSKFARENEAIADGLDTWENVKHDLGGFIGIFENSEVTELKHGFSIVLHTQFEKRKMDFTVTTNEDEVVTSVAFSPQYTIAENMEKAFLNMILGMGTVFLVLIFISFLIGRFKYISRLEEAMKNRKANRFGKAEEGKGTPGSGTEKNDVTGNAADSGSGNLTGDPAGDEQLAAVITAAIAASAGTNPSGLVVRSIRRSSAGKWKKA